MDIKEWTIMLYLNGTNDLGVEMESTFKSILNLSNLEDINIIIQIGKSPINLIRMIRQNGASYEEDWNGVRRYSIINGKLKFHDELKDLNMADYKSLYDFIQWGMSNFKSKRYFLSIAGHGFIGAILSELCLDKPYTMGIYELCKSLNSLEKPIDVLFLDICNMNTVEFIYELGKNQRNRIKYIMTYINNAPLSGFDYENIILSLKGIDTEEVLREIIEYDDNNMVAVKIDHGKLKKIKNLSNELSYRMLQLNKEEKDYDEDKVYNNLFYKIEDYINKMVIAEKNNDDVRLIQFIFLNEYGIEDIDGFINYYYKLAFTKNNYCTNLFENKSLDEPLNKKNSIAVQEELAFRDIETILSLYNIGLYNTKVLVKKIYKYMKWIK